jgi:UDP-N-acetylglucosamine 1-carboxyvinyltransferase
MSELKLRGGRPLFGEITVSGSKNAALPILFSTLAAKGVSRIERVPDITDVAVAVELLKGFGARVLREGDTLYIDTRRLSYVTPSEKLISSIRASTYLIGASLARFGRCALSDFGGCNFSPRPIDMHIDACIAFGAKFEGESLVCDRLTHAEILFSKRSVGATANSLILAASTEGESRIRGHAKEPHILNLVDFLRSAGAEITVTDDEIRIRGGELHGGCTEVIGDMIEAGSYLAAAVVTDGEITVSGCSLSDMAAYLEFLSEVGAHIEIDGNKITARRGSFSRHAVISAAPYPAYPTDLQPIAASVMASLSGGEIYDTVFPSRFGYLEGLQTLGVDSVRGSGFALIRPSRLRGGRVTVPDLRGGAACLLAALGADGESALFSAEILERGYSELEKKLRSLGAEVDRIR